MTLHITGQVQVPAPRATRALVKRVANRIAFELESQDVGRISETNEIVRYERGYSVRYRNGWFSSFDPGEFIVRAEGATVAIRYSLGLKPVQFVLAIALSSIAYVLYFFPHTPETLLLAAAPVPILGGGFLVSLWQIRRWLRAAAATAIRNAAQPDRKAR